MAIADPGDDGTPCPLSPTPVEVQIVRERMAIGLYDMPARRGGPDILVPLTIHVVRRTDGTGGLTPSGTGGSKVPAGALARRICTYSRPGDEVGAGTEFGFIKFGSRVDVFLPLHAQVSVGIGDRVQGARSVIAEFPSR